MKLSVIIVNYNVKHYLEQCLNAVISASSRLECEIIVVDNNSVDSSANLVKERFPMVQQVENKQNVGFSAANNQGIRMSCGEYVLLLNPDTIIEEDTLDKVVAFMDEHPDGGGLGVKMVNGQGEYLPESKRGIPTPGVAFYKISGLSALFPKSRRFGHYHLGYLDKDEIHQVEVLSGAFMLLRKKVLDETGLLDETFFMYGEDIDLSYRIVKAGYKNYYYPATRIIHYKGASTKKRSANYVFMFYNAMIIFAQKHFTKKNARLFSSLIRTAIYVRALVALVSRLLDKASLPLMDFALLFGGMFALKEFWEYNRFFHSISEYPEAFMMVAVPMYLIIWVCSVYLSGGYDRPIQLVKVLRGIIIGTTIILVLYALLDESYRFSRALILMGSVTSFAGMALNRFVFYKLSPKSYEFRHTAIKKIAIVGSREEGQRVRNLLGKTGFAYHDIGTIYPAKVPAGNTAGFLGNVSQLQEIADIHKIDELIFCAKDLPAHLIIDSMTTLAGGHIDYKIAPPETLYVIGSRSVDINGEIYPGLIGLSSINTTHNKRMKRMMDIFAAMMLIALAPVMVFIVSRPAGMLRNIALVLLARKTWVGPIYSAASCNAMTGIKQGVLTPADALKHQDLCDNDWIDSINLSYVKHYSALNDLHIMYKGLPDLGR